MKNKFYVLESKGPDMIMAILTNGIDTGKKYQDKNRAENKVEKIRAMIERINEEKGAEAS